MSLFNYFNSLFRVCSKVILQIPRAGAQIHNLFNILEDRIIEFELKEAPMEKFSFPTLKNLKKLILRDPHSIEFVQHILTTSEDLRTLIFCNMPLISFFVTGIKRSFKTINQIKELEVGSYIGNKILGDENDDKLQLEYLKIFQDMDYCCDFTNIERFLAKCKTLTNLDLSFINEKTVKIITETLVNLKSLTLSIDKLFSLHSFKSYHHHNSSIEELKLQCSPVEYLSLFFKLFPNLKVLRLKSATENELKTIFQNGKKLEKVYFKEDRERCLNFCKILMEENVEVTRNIQFLEG